MTHLEILYIIFQSNTIAKVKVNDINIYYEIHGEGYPFILIRGLSSSLDSWHPYSIKKFSKNFKKNPYTKDIKTT